MIRKMKMLTEIEKVLPSEIEKRSFEIITEELGDKKLVPDRTDRKTLHSYQCGF